MQVVVQVVLIEPQIPPNTGNVARLCAATRLPLHLVGKLGFRINDRHLRRAGLDYWDYTEIHRHDCVKQFLASIPISQLFFFSKKAQRVYIQAPFHHNASLVFGSETKGFPQWIFEYYPERLWRIPLFHPQVRSLNLSTAVSIVVYEALRQLGKLENGAAFPDPLAEGL